MTKVIVTGALGNVGANVIRELQKTDTEIMAIDLETKQNLKSYNDLRKSGEFSVKWLDLTKYEGVKDVLFDFEPDVIIHVAAILPPLAYINQKLARNVNVNATKFLIDTAMQLKKKPKFVFTSSYSVHGPFSPEENAPLLTGNTPVSPQDNYGKYKVECEEMIQKSQLQWVIVRLCAVLNYLPANMKMGDSLIQLTFITPLKRKTHAIDSRDVGLALANAALRDISNRIFDIGGDESWKLTGSTLMANALSVNGLGMLPEEAFRNPNPERKEDWYYEYWIDTEESQKELEYQRYSYSDHLRDAKKEAGLSRYLIRLVSPIARRILVKKSPYRNRTTEYDTGTTWEHAVRIFGIEEEAI
jgi:nucleoside-diphosphate-sugar epimerase